MPYFRRPPYRSMASILLQWLIHLVCLIGPGLAVLALAGARRDTAVHPVHMLLSGLAAIVLLSALWNWVWPVGAGAQVAALVGSGVIMGAYAGRLSTWVRAWWRQWCGLSVGARLAWWAVFLVALFKSASPAEVEDDGYYFLSTIQWIEQYRITPGIANLNDRLGFNSAFHLACAALGSLGPAPHGQGLNGLLLVGFAAFAIGGADRLIKGRGTGPDVLAALGLVYLMRNLLTSLSPDVSNILLGMVLLVLAWRRLDQGRMQINDLDLRLMGLYAVLLAMIKLSSLFLALFPVYFLLRLPAVERARIVPWAVALPLLLGLPWALRFVMLSGYLVFPIPGTDLLNVDWKLPAEVVRQQYHYVSAFARSNTVIWDSERVAAEGFLHWLPQWFARENLLNKAMALAMGASFLAGTGLLLLRGRWLWRYHRDALLLGLLLGLNVVVWFLRYPAFRFGWPWVIASLAVALHLALLHRPLLRRTALPLLVGLMLVQAVVKTVRETLTLTSGVVVAPLTQVATPHRTVDLNGVPLRVPLAPYCHELPPPCVLRDWAWRVEARGKRVEDGFRTRRDAVPSAP